MTSKKVHTATPIHAAKKSLIVQTSQAEKSVHTDNFIHANKTYGTVKTQAPAPNTNIKRSHDDKPCNGFFLFK